MRLHIDLKPRVVEARTKTELLSKIGNGYMHYFGTYGNGLSSKYKIRVYNLQKFNKKVERSVYTKNGKVVKKSKVVSPKRWVANVYDFDMDLLRVLKLKVKQQNKNFIVYWGYYV